MINLQDEGGNKFVGTFKGKKIFTNPTVAPNTIIIFNPNDLTMEPNLLEEALQHLEDAAEILNATDITHIEYNSHEGNGMIRWNKPYPIPTGLVGGSLAQGQ